MLGKMAVKSHLGDILEGYTQRMTREKEEVEELERSKMEELDKLKNR
jgi:hypothetical protein